MKDVRKRISIRPKIIFILSSCYVYQNYHPLPFYVALPELDSEPEPLPDPELLPEPEPELLPDPEPDEDPDPLPLLLPDPELEPDPADYDEVLLALLISDFLSSYFLSYLG